LNQVHNRDVNKASLAGEAEAKNFFEAEAGTTVHEAEATYSRNSDHYMSSLL